MKHIILLTLFITFCSPKIGAIDGIDIFFFSHPSSNEASLRIIDYNIAEQKLNKIYYINLNDIDSDDAFTSKADSHKRLSYNSINKILNPYGLTLQEDNTLCLEEFNPEKYMLRTNGKINESGMKEFSGYQLYDTSAYPSHYDKKYRYIYRLTSIRDGRGLGLVLTRASSSRVSHDEEFPTIFLPGETRVTLPQLKLAELADISIVTTALTMISSGYDQLLSRVDTRGRAFDGVFKDRSSQPDYFITESKCSSARVSTRTIMNKFFTDQYVYETIQEGLCDSRLQESMEELHNAIVHRPGCVFKFVHRMVMSGCSQSEVRLIDQYEYLKLSGKLLVDDLINNIRKLSLSERRRIAEALHEIEEKENLSLDDPSTSSLASSSSRP